jgi:hypothetical protein
MGLVRIRDAAERLGYSPTYAHQLIPRLMPVYRSCPAANAPLCVRQEDLDAYLAKVTAEPVKTPVAA